MEVKLFYRTQRDLATAVNQVIDAYWREEIGEQELVNLIKRLHLNNPSKMTKGDYFTTVIQQQCGKRRLTVVERILKIK